MSNATNLYRVTYVRDGERRTRTFGSSLDLPGMLTVMRRVHGPDVEVSEAPSPALIGSVTHA